MELPSIVNYQVMSALRGPDLGEPSAENWKWLVTARIRYWVARSLGKDWFNVGVLVNSVHDLVEYGEMLKSAQEFVNPRKDSGHVLQHASSAWREIVAIYPEATKEMNKLIEDGLIEP